MKSLILMRQKKEKKYVCLSRAELHTILKVRSEIVIFIKKISITKSSEEERDCHRI